MARSILVRMIAVAALVFVAPLSQMFAYAPYGWKWSNMQMAYYINPSTPDLTASAATAAIQASANAWTSQSNSPFSFYFMGYTTGTTASNNGKNEVFFRNATNGSAIATTYYWYSGSTALDADIVFWDAAYKFFTGSSGCSGGFYVEDVVAHEFGHALGLGHSSVSAATMVSGSPYCGTAKRSLDLDDITGLEKIYPATGTTNTAPSVSIVSPVPNAIFAAGAAITFSGSATDAQDGTLTSSITWTSSINGTLGIGGLLTKALSNGTHTITASVKDRAGVTSSSRVTVTVGTTTTTTTSGATLSVRGYKVKGGKRVDLTWSTVSWTAVDVYRNGARIVTTANDRAYTDSMGTKGGGTFSYKVCQSGSTVCSNQASVTF